MERLYGAYRGFREPALFADPDGLTARGLARGQEWGDHGSRLIRYRVLSAFAQQNAYRDIQGWPQQFRATYGQYEGVRDLFGVAFQLAEFWTAHLQGGDLDPKAGDGRSAPSALPILMDAEDPAVRLGIAELWRRSNWQIAKDIAARDGSSLGDTFIELCDDADAGTIRIAPMAPGRAKWCDLTREGDVEAYELEYRRPDPRRPAARETIDAPRPPLVRYNELVVPEGNGKGYRWTTYLDGVEFPWPGNPGSSWVIPDLPFAPLVKVQHKNLGLGWGQAEAMAALSGMRELADLASCVTDWSRRATKARHLMAGMRNPADDPAALAREARRPLTPTQERALLAGEFAGGEPASGWYPHQGRVESRSRNDDNFLYTTDAAARAQSLIHPLPVGEIGAQIDRLKAKLDGDYPELKFQQIQLGGNASGESFREARKCAEAKIAARRVEYDAGAARAFRMALVYGGLRGYRHYEGFGVDDLASGRLDFRIGPRPVFAPDPSEQIAERQARYAALKAATDAGLPLGLAMREAGYSDEDIAVAVKAEAEAQARTLANLQIRAKNAPVPPAAGDATPDGAAQTDA